MQEEAKVALVLVHPYTALRLADTAKIEKFMGANKELWDAFAGYERIVLTHNRFSKKKSLRGNWGRKFPNGVRYLLDIYRDGHSIPYQAAYHGTRDEEPDISKLIGSLKGSGIRDVVIAGGFIQNAKSPLVLGCVDLLVEKYLSDSYFRCWLVADNLVWVRKKGHREEGPLERYTVETAEDAEDSLLPATKKHARTITVGSILKEGVENFYRNVCLSEG